MSDTVQITLPLEREAGARSHATLASEWLQIAKRDNREYAGYYSAFEYRLALEWIAFELLYKINYGNLDEVDWKSLRKVKNMENRIYELEGHQLELDRKFRFTQIIFEGFDIEGFPTISSVSLGQLKAHWSTCSEYCHIDPATINSSGKEDCFHSLLKDMDDVKSFVDPLVNGLLIWPMFHEPWFEELHNQYLEQQISEQDVIKTLKKNGIRLELKAKDGSRESFTFSKV